MLEKSTCKNFFRNSSYFWLWYIRDVRTSSEQRCHDFPFFLNCTVRFLSHNSVRWWWSFLAFLIFQKLDHRFLYCISAEMLSESYISISYPLTLSCFLCLCDRGSFWMFWDFCFNEMLLQSLCRRVIGLNPCTSLSKILEVVLRILKIRLLCQFNP